MKQVQLPCCMGGVRVTVKNKWTNMSKNKRNFIITELLLGVHTCDRNRFYRIQ